MTLDGALVFARFAFPPNERGYCGPDASAELLERAALGIGGPDLRALAQGFAGAWPYLELIAGANAIADPLDHRVVEAYWLGNALLERVPARAFADSLATRFGAQVRHRDRLLAPLDVGAAPHHGFHVFGVYPWVGLLRGGRRLVCVSDSARPEKNRTRYAQCRRSAWRARSVAGGEIQQNVGRHAGSQRPGGPAWRKHEDLAAGRALPGAGCGNAGRPANQG